MTNLRELAAVMNDLKDDRRYLAAEVIRQAIYEILQLRTVPVPQPDQPLPAPAPPVLH